MGDRRLAALYVLAAMYFLFLHADATLYSMNKKTNKVVAQ